MSTPADSKASRITWFVGAAYSGSEDQSSRFISEGIWENGYTDRYLDTVRSMSPGDRIAIKSSYTRKYGLPFDNQGHTVSVLAIKAIGTITENLGDGRRVRVDWTQVDPIREWYFYTNRGTIWQVRSGEWKNDALIAFAFDGEPQDISRFCNEPSWRARFGSNVQDPQRFRWTKFYEAVAEALLSYATNRQALVEGIHLIASRVQGLGNLQDKFPDGSSGPLRDICPFTAMGIFNRSTTDANRRAIAGELATLLGVSIPVPDSFEGVPFLNNQKSWFFGYADERQAGDIDALWRVFAAGKCLLQDDQSDGREEFIRAYDAAIQIRGVAWNLSTGLYWANPWQFPTLDSQSRNYLKRRLGFEVVKSGQQGACDARRYLELMEELRSRFGESDYPVHSFPDLSLASWNSRDLDSNAVPNPDAGSEEAEDEALEPGPRDEFRSATAITPYAVEDILKDGCFLEHEEVDDILDRLRSKKNLILLGPPGTGKTWLAKRLAFALIGHKDSRKLRAVQFHPNLSYEDFVRGWRPSGDGKLVLADGVFMEAVKAATAEPLAKFVVVIEEINRGNPAQVFGELLTLLEDGKRGPSEALELCYPDADGRRRPVFVPENLYVIGTMNAADRSLAMVDLALRRRFAFISLEPRLGRAWREWLVHECAADSDLVAEIELRIAELNKTIANDDRLGAQFLIGHSFVTPSGPLEPGKTKRWFRRVVETEIGPLLEEYWFDKPKNAKEACAQLLRNW